MDIPREKKPNRKRYVLIGAGILAVVVVSAALSRLEPAAPAVDSSMIFTDVVQRGPMLREVRGPGNLVPEDIRWITTLTPGRVDRVHVRPGTEVTRGTVLVELSNPDVNIQALQAEQALTAAEAQLASLRTDLETQRLNQEGAVAAMNREYQEALRQVNTHEELARDGLVPANELENARGRAEELAVRLEIERKRLAILTESIESQLEVQRQQVERLRAIAEFQRDQLDAMRIRATADGVLQQMNLEVGQWVIPGNTLGAVVQPGRLKAELRIPETQIRDVTVGQPVRIDTRNGIVPGSVIRVDPSVVNGAVVVEVALEGELPRGARPDLSVDGTIEVERLDDVLHVGRPAYGQAESTVGLFRLTPDGTHAERIPVRLGRASVSRIEVVDGLKEGDVVILSDMATWDQYERVRIR